MGTKPKKLLVVDDDEMLLDTVTESLRDEGYEVTTASDGRQALQILFTESIPVILSDIDMPQLSGIELLERVKKSDESVRVILMTGNDTERNFNRALYRGAFNFIEKPFDREILVGVVAEAFAAIGD